MSSPRSASEFSVAPETPTPKRSLGQKLLAVALVLGILAAALFGRQYLLATKPQAKRRPPAKMETLVQVIPLMATDHPMTIRAMGTVTATTLDLKPRTEGAVVALHPNFVRGGLIRKGETLVFLDDADQRLAVLRATNSLQRAAMDLRIEEGNQAVAKREFELIGELSSGALKNAPGDLALRQPQLAKAKATEAIARADLEQAELALARTKVLAPFDALVLEDKVALGAQVNSQTTLARLAATDAYFILASLPENELKNFSLPADKRAGASVRVSPAGEEDGNAISWRGTVDSLPGEVEAGSLMAQVRIRIDKPLEQQPGRRLLLDSAVDVAIDGNMLSGVFRLPRSAVRADGSVLLAAADNSLLIRSTEIIWRDREWVYARGLSAGDRLIVSPVPAPVAGMPLRIADGKGKNDQGTGKDA